MEAAGAIQIKNGDAELSSPRPVVLSAEDESTIPVLRVACPPPTAAALFASGHDHVVLQLPSDGRGGLYQTERRDLGLPPLADLLVGLIDGVRTTGEVVDALLDQLAEMEVCACTCVFARARVYVRARAHVCVCAMSQLSVSLCMEAAGDIEIDRRPGAASIRADAKRQVFSPKLTVGFSH